MEIKIPIDQAIKEVNDWLDRKKVLPSQREAYSEQIDTIAEAVSLGILTLDDKGQFTQELMFPFEEELSVTKFTYKARLNDRILEPYMKGVKSSDADGRAIAYLAALTNQPKAVIKSLDSQDKRIAHAIVVFFAA